MKLNTPLTKAIAILAGSSLAFAASSVSAASIDQALQKSQAKVAAAKKSQQRIDKLQEQTQDLLGQFKITNDQIDDLALYNELQQKKVEARRKALEDLNERIGRIDSIKQGIDPLTQKMLDALEDFIRLDLPFNTAERLETVTTIRNRDVKSAEQFRQALEAYEIESQYGRKVQFFPSALLPIDGQDLPVDMLAVGRIALVAQTPDTQTTLAYDRTSQQWQVLPSGEYRTAIQKAIKIAKNQAPNNIVRLPIPAPGE